MNVRLEDHRPLRPGLLNRARLRWSTLRAVIEGQTALVSSVEIVNHHIVLKPVFTGSAGEFDHTGRLIAPWKLPIAMNRSLLFIVLLTEGYVTSTPLLLANRWSRRCCRSSASASNRGALGID